VTQAGTQESTDVRNCIYQEGNNTYKSYAIHPFHIDKGEVTLKEDWEQHLGRGPGKPKKEEREGKGKDVALYDSDDIRFLEARLRNDCAFNADEEEDDTLEDGEGSSGATSEGPTSTIPIDPRLLQEFGVDGRQNSSESADVTHQRQLPPASLTSATKETTREWDVERFRFAGQTVMDKPLDADYPVLDQSKIDKFRESKLLELDAHREKGTWYVAPQEAGVKPVTSRWVNTTKYGPQGEFLKHKSRLVARGFQQEEGVDFEETFAPVVKSSSTRILLALAALKGWTVHQADVKTAFLNSDLEKHVDVRPPKDVLLPKNCVLRVVRALYGLKQSPRAWYMKLRDTLLEWGWRISQYDPCVFIQDKTGLLMEVHVDDIDVTGGNLAAILEFKQKLASMFAITDMGQCSWYLGMHVEQSAGEVRIHQRKYIEEMMDRFGFTEVPAATTPLERGVKLSKNEGTATARFRTDYQSKVGSLNWAANQTRPDISFATGYVARYASNPNQDHMDAVDRIFCYLKGDPGKSIVYTNKHGLELKGFVDSDFAGCEDSRKSTGGYVFMLSGGPVSWASQRQKTVATSTLDAEYIAAAEAAKEAVWIRNFINDLRIPGIHITNVPLYIDSNSALRLTRNPEYHSKSKHIDVRHHFIREKVEEGVIDTQRVNTRDNLADMFTKGLPRDTHEGLTGRMGLHEQPHMPFAGMSSLFIPEEGSDSEWQTQDDDDDDRSSRAKGEGKDPSQRNDDLFMLEPQVTEYMKKHHTNDMPFRHKRKVAAEKREEIRSTRARHVAESQAKVRNAYKARRQAENAHLWEESEVDGVQLYRPPGITNGPKSLGGDHVDQHDQHNILPSIEQQDAVERISESPTNIPPSTQPRRQHSLDRISETPTDTPPSAQMEQGYNADRIAESAHDGNYLPQEVIDEMQREREAVVRSANLFGPLELSSDEEE
jgi:hypothetical protein